MFPLVLYPPLILRLCIALFAVAEGWLLLDIRWFVLFFLHHIQVADIEHRLLSLFIDCIIVTFYIKSIGGLLSNKRNQLLISHWLLLTDIMTKRRRSDPVLWHKPLHQLKCQKGIVTTQTTPQISSMEQQLRTDLGRSVGVTTVTQLVWLTWFAGPPSHSPQQPCYQKDTHLTSSGLS